MGQTVRNQGPYDRLWIPGGPRNRAEKSDGSKIEYLEDRRKARQAQLSAPPDALQYDSNFRKAAAVHGERPGRQHFLKESPQPLRPRPQGVGGRQQTPSSGQPRSSAQSRGRQSETTRQRDAKAQGRPGQVQSRDAVRPRTQDQVRPGAKQPAQQRPAQSKTQAKQARPQAKGPTQTGRPPRTKGQMQTVRPPRAKGQVQPARNQQAAARSAAGKSARQRPAAPRPSGRPQRDTVTDFHSVAPSAAAAAKKQAPRKHPVKGNGHGRKLTPTYKNKTSDHPRTKLNGAPLMKNGVVGFDMGAYGTDSAPADSHARPLKASSVITTILTIAICFVLLTGVLAGRARLSNYSQQNAGLENSIAEMEERISKLKMQIALEEDLGNIQERASALGLSNPDDAQIEYVDLDATDEVKAVPSLTLSQGSSSAPDGLLGAIAAWLDSVMLESGQTELSSAAASASVD